MKKTVLFIAAILCTSLAFAQKKGEINIGGEFGFGFTGKTTVKTSSSVNGNKSSDTQKYDNDSFNFNLGASGSYFILDNLAINAGIGYDVVTNPSSDPDLDIDLKSLNGFKISAGASYYVELCKNFYWTPGLVISNSYKGHGEKDDKLSIKTSIGINTFTLGLNLARLEYRFNQHYSVFTNLGGLYLNINSNTMKMKSTENSDYYTTTTTTPSFSFSLASTKYSPSLGFSYWF